VGPDPEKEKRGACAARNCSDHVSYNLVFSEWDRIFKDPMTTAAAIDRLVHHSTILELDNDSYRAKQAKQQQGN